MSPDVPMRTRTNGTTALQRQTQRQPFLRWMKQFVADDSAFGDLARDFRDDPTIDELPSDSLRDLYQHLSVYLACQGAFDTLIRAYRQWQSEGNTFRSPDKPIGQARALSGVYVLHCADVYKIGRGRNAALRVRQIQTNTPFPVEHLFTIATSNAVALERELHQRFAERRVRGEWFALITDDIEYLRRLM